jgi:hypothetical protein
MTQDEIIEMAIQGHAGTRDAIRWAMQQEREACASTCEQAGIDGLGTLAAAALIRKRGYE